MVGLAAATVYGSIAGWQPPVLRAWLMTLLGALAWSSRTVPALLAVWRTALLVVGLSDPVGLLHPGPWLSFFAVLILLLAAQTRVAQRLPLTSAFRLQGLVTLTTLPLLALWGLTFSPSGLLANLVAVPAVSLLVVPACLLGTVLAPGCGGLADWLFAAADNTLLLVFAWLEFLTQLRPWPPVAGFEVPRTMPLCLAAAVFAVPLLLQTHRAHGVSLLLAGTLCFSWRPSGPPPGEFSLTAFDVGQGSAVLVRTQQHSLLFDAGPRTRSGFDLGEAVVVPALRAARIGQLRKLVVSHGDIDHVGGATAVVAALQPLSYVGGAGVPTSRCRAGDRWRWDDVDFEFLHPNAQGSNRNLNDGSCVLLVKTATERVLLPGDIGRGIEHRILGDLPSLTLLVAPHHGSVGSSSPAFVAKTKPAIVVFQAGYRNRFDHPDPRVLARYQKVGTKILRTDAAGAVNYRSWRSDLQYWRRRSSAVWRVPEVSHHAP